MSGAVWSQSYQHTEPLNVRPDHQVHHGWLVSAKERSSLLLQLAVHLLQLGPDGGPVVLGPEWSPRGQRLTCLYGIRAPMIDSFCA